MTRTELHKEYNDMWRSTNPGLFAVQVVSIFVGVILDGIATFLIIKEGIENDFSYFDEEMWLPVLILLGISLAVDLIAVGIAISRSSGWTTYYAENADRIS